MEFDDNDIQILKMLLSIMSNILEHSGGFYELANGETFSRNDLYDLAQKLGITDY